MSLAASLSSNFENWRLNRGQKWYTNRRPFDVYLCRSVATSAAKRVAAVRAGGGRSSSTLTVSCTNATSLGVLSAVIGRAFHVDEFRVADRLASHALLPATEQRRGRARSGGGGDHGSRRDLDRQLVLVLEGVADASERRQRFPAGPDGARARHAVTAALGRHVLHHDLRITPNTCRLRSTRIQNKDNQTVNDGVAHSNI